MERQIGEIVRYFPKIGVGVLRLEDDLVEGDEILIRGSGKNFIQKVESMQVEHTPIREAVKGQEIGLKMQQKVSIGDRVYKTS
ncbi:MAG: hypothetical protein LUQ40_00910 [Methanomicrobiales archaeon]|nr:hypothetical protein [Methanomicrobiales archaeon]